MRGSGIWGRGRRRGTGGGGAKETTFFFYIYGADKRVGGEMGTELFKENGETLKTRNSLTFNYL
jgi:hypothetical protein